MTGLVEVSARPVPSLVGLDAPHGAPHAVLADDRTQAEQARGDVVAAQGRKVGVAEMPRKDAQKEGAEHIARRVGAVAAVAQRHVGDQRVEGSGRGQKLGEEHQRPQ